MFARLRHVQTAAEREAEELAARLMAMNDRAMEKLLARWAHSEFEFPLGCSGFGDCSGLG